MLLTFGIALLVISQVLTISGAFAMTSSTSPLPEFFPSDTYKVTEHVHSTDEGSISNYYYSKFTQNYDKVFFA